MRVVIRWAALSLAALWAAVTMAGCDGARGSTPGPGLTVVATTSHVAHFARIVGGDMVRVTPLLPPNVDPHDYDLSPADLVELSGARLVVRNGVGLEPWLDDALAAAGYAGPVVDCSEGVPLRTRGGEPDPHIWQNPRNVKIMVRNIAAGLVRVDPDNRATYEKNRDEYLAKLDALDAQIEAKISTIPPDRRKFLSNHDAFGYYLDRYGIEFIGAIIPSMDTSAELSARQIDDLVALIRASGVRAVFSENSLPADTAETIGRQAGVTVVAGEGALYADALGPEGSVGSTYIGAMTHNTDVIVAALRG